MCDGCKEEDEKVRGKASHGALNASAAVADHIAATRGGGAALPGSTRAFFEPRLGFDLSRVRVHADEQAHSAANQLGAHAFTLGRDIYFGARQFAPATHEGRRLIAHELVHVAQQNRRSLGVQRSPLPSPVSEAAPFMVQRDARDPRCPGAPETPPPAGSAPVVGFADGRVEVDNPMWTGVLGPLAARIKATKNSGAEVQIHGYASASEPDPVTLACSRASGVADVLKKFWRYRIPNPVALFAHGGTSEFGDAAQNRRAMVSIPEAAGSSAPGGAPTPSAPAAAQPIPQPTPAERCASFNAFAQAYFAQAPPSDPTGMSSRGFLMRSIELLGGPSYDITRVSADTLVTKFKELNAAACGSNEPPAEPRNQMAVTATPRENQIVGRVIMVFDGDGFVRKYVQGTPAQLDQMEQDERAKGAVASAKGMWFAAAGIRPGSANPPITPRAGAAFGPARTYEPRVGAYHPEPEPFGGLTPPVQQPAPPARGPVAPPPASQGAAGPTARPRATAAQLRDMIANSNDYFTWRTTDKDVASNQPIRFTGQNTPGGENTPQAIHVTRGLSGVSYGKYQVIIKGSDFRLRSTPDALEFIVDGEIPVEKSVWCTTEDIEAAKPR
jgi:hypothetical protein